MTWRGKPRKQFIFTIQWRKPRWRYPTTFIALLTAAGWREENVVVFVNELQHGPVNTDISILEFYEYIKNIGEIFMDILIKILIKQKWFKIHENA